MRGLDDFPTLLDVIQLSLAVGQSSNYTLYTANIIVCGSTATITIRAGFMNQYSETPRVESTSFDLDYEDHEPYTRQRERRFLWKLDVCLISWAWLAYLIKASL